MAFGDRFPLLKEKIAQQPVRTFAAGAFVKTAMGIIHKTADEGKHIFSPEEADEKISSYKSRFVEVDGYRIHYRDEGQGQPVLLLHGFAASLQVWNDWEKLLKDRFRIIRMDMPGFALSGPMHSSTEITIDFFTSTIRKFLDKIGIDQVILGGNSLGGWISWEFASAYPERVKKLALLNAAGYITPETKPKSVELLSSPRVSNLIRTGVPKIVVRMLIRQSFGDKRKLKSEMVDRHYVLTNRRGNLATLLRLANTSIYPDTEKIKQINIPTLVMWGNRDRVIPYKFAHKFGEDLPQARVIIYDRIGHIPMVEIPERSAEDFAAFAAGE